jgi:hypothetical protein
MQGGNHGAIVIPGDAENSLLVTIQQSETPHFGQFTNRQLEWVISWINSGANQ